MSAACWSADTGAPAQKARITQAANPNDYYPPDSIRRGETGAPVMQVCVDATGKLLHDPLVAESSGFPNLDAAAVKVAKNTSYAPGTENDTPLPESCLKFKVKFALNTSAGIASAANPADYYSSDAKGRKEQGTAIVHACVGPDGSLLRDPEIAVSSGFPELDAAAIKVAKASRYSAGKVSGTAVAESCIKFKVMFVLKDE